MKVQEEMKSPIRPVVIVNPRLRILDAFTNSHVRFFLPTDTLGNIVDVKQAVRLECWISKPDVKRKHLPDVFGYSAGGLSLALIKRHGGNMFGSITVTAANLSLGKLNDWLHTLYRHPEEDVVSYVYEESVPAIVPSNKEVPNG